MKYDSNQLQVFTIWLIKRPSGDKMNEKYFKKFTVLISDTKFLPSRHISHPNFCKQETRLNLSIEQNFLTQKNFHDLLSVDKT